MCFANCHGKWRVNLRIAPTSSSPPSSPVSIRNSHRSHSNSQHSCGEHQHKRGRADAFEITDPQMGYAGPQEIEYKPDSRHDPGWWPPDSNRQSNCASKLASSQRREIIQRHTDGFVDYFNLAWVAPDLADPGEHYHQCKPSDCDVYGRHLAVLLSVAIQSGVKPVVVLSQALLPTALSFGPPPLHQHRHPLTDCGTEGVFAPGGTMLNWLRRSSRNSWRFAIHRCPNPGDGFGDLGLALLVANERVGEKGGAG